MCICRTWKNKVPSRTNFTCVALVWMLMCRVMAQVSSQVVKPYDDSPFEGIFTISTEFSPMASASFEPARVGPYELLLSRTLDNTLRRARALDLESLCILAKKLAWSIRVDVHFLDHDGGLVDAATVAVVASLLSFRREDVEVRGEEVKVVCSLVPKRCFSCTKSSSSQNLFPKSLSKIFSQKLFPKTPLPKNPSSSAVSYPTSNPCTPLSHPTN